MTSSSEGEYQQRKIQ